MIIIVLNQLMMASTQNANTLLNEIRLSAEMAKVLPYLIPETGGDQYRFDMAALFPGSSEQAEPSFLSP